MIRGSGSILNLSIPMLIPNRDLGAITRLTLTKAQNNPHTRTEKS